jgi:hypothetical protein
MGAVSSLGIDINLQGFTEHKIHNSPSLQEICCFSHCQHRHILKGAEDCSESLGIFPANEKNMARPGLTRCLHGSHLYAPVLGLNIFCKLHERSPEIRVAKQAQLHGCLTVRKRAGRPFDKTGKMSEKIRFRPIPNRRLLLSLDGKGNEKQTTNQAVRKHSRKGQTLLSTATAIEVEVQCNSLSCRIYSSHLVRKKKNSKFDLPDVRVAQANIRQKRMRPARAPWW